MKFIGWKKLENGILTLFTFRDENSFKTLAGYTKEYQYNTYKKELYENNVCILKGELFGNPTEPAFKILLE